MMIEFKEWAKDKMFYSTPKDYIRKEISFYEVNIDCRDTITSVNEVELSVCDDYEWSYNQRPFNYTKERKELEGWVYKKDYDKDPFKYQNPDMWNPIPDEYRNIKIKQ